MTVRSITPLVPCQHSDLVAPRGCCLRTLKDTGLIRAEYLGHFQVDLVSIIRQCFCVCSGRSSKWNACCTVPRQVGAMRPEGPLGTNFIRHHHSALESPASRPSEEGKAIAPRPYQASGPHGLGSQLGPSLRILIPSSSFSYHGIYFGALCRHTMSVMVNAIASLPQLTSQSKMGNCPQIRHEELSNDRGGD